MPEEFEELLKYKYDKTIDQSISHHDRTMKYYIINCEFIYDKYKVDSLYGYSYTLGQIERYATDIIIDIARHYFENFKIEYTTNYKTKIRYAIITDLGDASTI